MRSTRIIWSMSILVQSTARWSIDDSRSIPSPRRAAISSHRNRHSRSCRGVGNAKVTGPLASPSAPSGVVTSCGARYPRRPPSSPWHRKITPRCRSGCNTAGNRISRRAQAPSASAVTHHLVPSQPGPQPTRAHGRSKWRSRRPGHEERSRSSRGWGPCSYSAWASQHHQSSSLGTHREIGG